MSGTDVIHKVMESECRSCKHFMYGTDGGSIWHEGKSYGWCERPPSGAPFFLVPMAPPDPGRPNDPWNHWRPDMSGSRMAKLAVLPDHYCSGWEQRR